MNNIKLLPLELKYCESVLEIAASCLPEHWSLEAIRDVLRYDNNIYYVAMDTVSHHIVGFAGIMIIADEAELLNIAVLKSYQKRGIGQLLMDQVLEDAKKHNCVRILLEVREHNIGALSFYRNNGYEVLGKRNNYYNNPTEDAVIMAKQLDIL